MPRVHHVKKAQKDYPAHGIKKGEPYFWWKPMVGGRGASKRFSKTRPRQSQVTQSEFLSAVYSAEESVSDALGEFQGAKEGGYDELASALESAAGEVRQAGEDCQEKFDNMPEGLQQGDSGQLLEQRVGRCDEFADELESVASEIRELDPGETGKAAAEDAAREAGEIAEDEAASPRDDAAAVVENLSWDFE